MYALFCNGSRSIFWAFTEASHPAKVLRWGDVDDTMTTITFDDVTVKLLDCHELSVTVMMASPFPSLLTMPSPSTEAMLVSDEL